MPVKCGTIMRWIEEWAPPFLAEDKDNIGLLVGSPEMEIQRILVTLEVTQEVVDEAVRKGAQMIVSHHPLFRDPLYRIRFDSYPASLVVRLIQHNIAVYAAHTNLDAAEGGINDILARRFGLTDVDFLVPTREERLYKMVVFVPSGYEEVVRGAMCSAGAGWIGKYSDCTFQTGGTGTFRPLAGASPFLGKVGELEKVSETRIETIVPEGKLESVVRAMMSTHPYEEVAYDIYPLKNRGKRFGLGRVGKLPRPQTLGEFAEELKHLLGQQTVRVVGQLDKTVSRVAICGGGAAVFLNQAVRAGADVYVTGDVRHHDALNALAQGIALIDAGHHGTERVIVPVLAGYLRDKATEESYDLLVEVSEVNTDPFQSL